MKKIVENRREVIKNGWKWLENDKRIKNVKNWWKNERNIDKHVKIEIIWKSS